MGRFFHLLRQLKHAKKARVSEPVNEPVKTPEIVPENIIEAAWRSFLEGMHEEYRSGRCQDVIPMGLVVVTAKEQDNQIEASIEKGGVIWRDGMSNDERVSLLLRLAMNNSKRSVELDPNSIAAFELIQQTQGLPVN